MKLKEFLKKYLIGFFIGLILFTVVGVSAAAVFPSNQTTYNNGTTGMSATNVQTAIDELYNTCFPPKTGGEAILEKVPIVNSGDGLYKDENEDKYFYRGKNPNNYITFNNETWRIVSIESDGTIKIMRDENLGIMEWDSAYLNKWDKPASLNTYLNGTYLTSTLNATAQSQIVAKNWSIGSVTDSKYNNDLAEQIKKENSKKWNGKVALITVSEYIRTNSNQSSCGTYIKNDDNYESCQNTTWMIINDDWWTLSPLADNDSGVFSVVFTGETIARGTTSTSSVVRPSVYLSSDIKITGGNGSLVIHIKFPYKIEEY